MAFSHAEKQRAWRTKVKLEAIDAYGGKCSCCGETQIEFLAIDHINGGGQKHRKSGGSGGADFCSRLRSLGFPKDRYRLLCHNCNSSLGFFGYCPHTQESKYGPSIK